MTTLRTKRESGDIARSEFMHDKTAGSVAHGRAGHKRVGRLAIETGFAAALGLSIMLTTSSARPSRTPVTATIPATPDSSRFILHTLLVPTLDVDALPLRWVALQPASRCGADTTVRVNGEPPHAETDNPVKLMVICADGSQLCR